MSNAAEFCCGVAQLAEPRTHNPVVAGSSPASATPIPGNHTCMVPNNFKDRRLVLHSSPGVVASPGQRISGAQPGVEEVCHIVDVAGALHARQAV